MQEIDPDSVAMDQFRECRNSIAHMTDTELDEFEFHDHLQMIINAVNEGFKGRPEQRRKWRLMLDQIRTEDISAAEYLQPRFRVQAETVKLYEVAITNIYNNDNKSININIAYGHANIGRVFNKCSLSTVWGMMGWKLQTIV